MLTEPAHRSQTVREFLKDEKGKKINLKWLTPQGEVLDIKTGYETSGSVYLNQLKTSTYSDKKLLLKSSPYFIYEVNEDVVYVEISTFSGQSFHIYEERVVPILDQYQGVIFDIRNNAGGNLTNALIYSLFQMLRYHMVIIIWGQNFTPRGYPMRMRRILFSIPEVILIKERCG